MVSLLAVGCPTESGKKSLVPTVGDAAMPDAGINEPDTPADWADTPIDLTGDDGLTDPDFGLPDTEDAPIDVASDTDELDGGPDAETTPPGPECGTWTQLLDAPEEPGDLNFPFGIGSGAIRSDRAIIWARPTFDGDVVVHFSAGPDCAEETTAPMAATGATDRTVHIPLKDLVPNTLYRYRIELIDGAGPSSPGWLVTAPAEDVPFTLMVTADITDDTDWYGLLPEVVGTPAEAVLFLGDWPYMDHGAPAKTLAEYREKHRNARTHPDIHEMMRQLPFMANWDDHEVVNDWDGADTASKPAQVAAGIQAWREYFVFADAPAGEVYRSYHWGPEVEMFQLDTRSHRDANSAPNGIQKTMLGDEQLAWLLAGLSESTAQFKLILTSVPLDFGTTNNDHWPGFIVERDAILDHITENQIPGVIFLTGDQHWFAAHHMPNGPKEFQFGALAQKPRKPAWAPIWVPIQIDVLNYGLMDYSPGPPATLTFTAWTLDSELLYTETVQAGRGSIAVAPSVDNAGWTLGGAHVFAGKGTTTLDWATPGTYTMNWQPANGGPAPPPETLTLVDGGTITFQGDYEAAGNDVAFLESFAGGSLAPTWTIVNQGIEDSTPAWTVKDGAAVETGNAYDYDEDEATVEKLGTWLWASSMDFKEGTLTAQVYAGDNDGFGLQYAVQGQGTYYRFSVDNQRSFARLVRVENGTFTVLDEELNYAPPLETWMTLTVERDGTDHALIVNGQTVLFASDGALGGGGIGLYSYGMSDVRFDDVQIFEP